MQMTEACQVDEWNRTALLACLIANPNRDAKKHPKPFDNLTFHPFIKREKRQPTKASKLFSVFGEPETVTETTWAKAVPEM